MQTPAKILKFANQQTLTNTQNHYFTLRWGQSQAADTSAEACTTTGPACHLDDWRSQMSLQIHVVDRCLAPSVCFNNASMDWQYKTPHIIYTINIQKLVCMHIWQPPKLHTNQKLSGWCVLTYTVHRAHAQLTLTLMAPWPLQCLGHYRSTRSLATADALTSCSSQQPPTSVMPAGRALAAEILFNHQRSCSHAVSKPLIHLKVNKSDIYARLALFSLKHKKMQITDIHDIHSWVSAQLCRELYSA